MKLTTIILSLSLIISMNSCIQDDFVDDTVAPEIRITSVIDTLGFNALHQFDFIYLDNTGQEELVDAVFSSSNQDIISITPEGLASGFETGEATIAVTYFTDEINVKDSITVTVGENTSTTERIINGQIATTTFYVLEGDFEYQETSDGVSLSLAENYEASSSLPGLYVYLSNNRNSIANAYEIGPVQVFSGAHEYDIPGVNFDDFSFIVYFCKPFNVKVGDGEL